MGEKPEWLPDIVSVDGEWNEVLAKLYEIFEKDFNRTKLTFNGKQIWWDRRKLDGFYEEVFWHLVTKQDSTTGDRLLDNRRAERLNWCVPIICNANDKAVKVWDFKEVSGYVRTYLWPEHFDYVVVLHKSKIRLKKEVYFLITAFHLDGESRRRSLRGKYEKREP